MATCQELPTIVEPTPSPEEENSRLEQLMISMLEEREKLMDKLRETQEVYSETAQKLSLVEVDNNILLRQLQALMPKEEDQESLHALLQELRSNSGSVNSHLGEVQKWPIAAEIVSLARELASMKEAVAEKEEEVQELKAERANMKLLLEHLECLVSRHEKSLRVTVLKRKTASTGVSSEVEVLKALKSLFDHHKALDEKVRERLRAANERNTLLEEELVLANQEIKSLQEEMKRMKRQMAQRNSFRMSANYDAIGFTQEQLSMLQEKDQTISDLQFALDERTAELEDAIQNREELTERVQETEDEMELVLGDLHKTKTELTKLKQSMQSTQVQQESSSQLKQELMACQEQLSAARVENEQLSNKVSLLETQILKEQEVSQGLKSNLKQKELSLVQANTVREEQKKKHSEQLTVAEKKQVDFETRILDLQAQVEQKTQLIQSAQEKEKTSQDHIDRLQSTVERMLKESNQRMKTHYSEKKSLMDEKNSLSEKLDTLRNELVTTQNENASLKDQLDRFKRELQLAKQKLDDLQRFNRHSRVTDLDIAKVEYSTKRSNSEVSSESDSQNGEGTETGIDKGSWDFTEPEAVSRLMSMLEGQVSVLDQQLQSIDVPSEKKLDSSVKPVSTERNNIAPSLGAPPPGSPPPPSPMRINLRVKNKQEILPISVYQAESRGGTIVSEENSVPPIQNSSKSKIKGTSSGSTGGSKGISSSVKKVFRRKSSNNGRVSEKKEKRNSAPTMGEVGSTYSPPSESQRTSLDLSQVTVLIDPTQCDQETRDKKKELVKKALDQGTPFSEWNSELVVPWLEVWVGIPGWYMSALRRNTQSGALLESLTEADYGQALGITNSMHKLKLRLALQEIVSLSSSQSLTKTTPFYGDMSHDWISDYWLPSLGLPQYCDIFRVCLVDARMLEHLTKKDLRTVLKMVDSGHRNSLQYGITVLKRLDYSREELEKWRQESATPADVVIWTNEHVIKWVESIGLGEYATNLCESGVHGGVIALDHDFDAEKLALALKISQTHTELRKLLKMEFSSLLAEGTNRTSAESQSHGKIVKRISKKLKVGRRVPTTDFVQLRPTSPLIVSGVNKPSLRQSPIQESTTPSPLLEDEGIFKEMTV